MGFNSGFKGLNSMKIRPNAAELFHAGGRTDRRTDRHDEAITLAFSQFFRTRLNTTVGKAVGAKDQMS